MAFEFSDGLNWAMAAPFAAALVAPFAKRMLGHNAAWLLALVPAAIFVHLCGFIEAVAAGNVVRSTPLAWLPQYNIQYSLFVDGLSLVFALLISGIGTCVILYSGGYLKGHPEQGRFLSFMFLFMGSMLGVVVADNLITLFFYWELTSITSFLLIGFNHRYEASRRAALQALVVTGGGGLALLAGLILMSQVGGSMELSQLLTSGDVLRDNPAYTAMLLLVLGGAFTKSAQFPFHFWLRNAMEAPTPVSAYLHSATMVKAGVYLLMRVHPVLGDTTLWMTILPIVGGVTLIMGTWMSLRQTDLKLTLAYTTVASLGLLVLLVGTSNQTAITGAVLYLFAHALFKGGLFMIVGTVDHEAGSRDVTQLGGLRKVMPITFYAAILCALSMSGIYPMIGFIAKEEIYAGIIGTDFQSVILTITVVVGNGMLLAAAFVVALKPFLGEEKAPKKAHEGPVLLIFGPVVLSLLGFLAMLFGSFTAHGLLSPMANAVTGQETHLAIGLGVVHFNLPLLLSLVTVVLGVGLFLKVETIRNTKGTFIRMMGEGPDRFFDTFISGLIRVSARFTRLVQGGNLEVYLAVTFTIVAATLLTPMILFDELPDWPSIPSMHFYEWAVLGLAVVGLFAILVARSRLTAIISLGIQGFSVALIFLLFGAPDLSFTQFMVETLSVVIIALVMSRLSLAERDGRPKLQMVGDATIAVLVGAGFGLLLMSVTQGAFDRHVSDFFTSYSRVIAHGRNIVNVIIVDFRGLDTLGEIAVVMIAGLSVLTLTRGTAKRFRSADGDGGETRGLPGASRGEKGTEQ
ncbi:putative monovalent cation/H+ antiporter subunit A [Cohaesibacter celericrescens]|uniref:Na(+)/H(+) antiporter subunit A n=1 Tax=Cohaesibacter celericrescens TaxID=2067669 RepID=A0A2N5XRE1_9HYPH|nr:putative monovalent cation/H+ antiporter subunit A [Cohaesibacter celericrescens]PLW76988.1 Na(+)/H(+) antiporter subunit A [Cohaesibacter celericrescens]